MFTRLNRTVAGLTTHAYLILGAADSLVSWFNMFGAADHPCRWAVSSHIPSDLVLCAGSYCCLLTGLQSQSLTRCVSPWLSNVQHAGRVPFTELLNQCGAAEGGPPASLVGATPCMSALALHKLSLESAQPPSRVHGCWKG